MAKSKKKAEGEKKPTESDISKFLAQGITLVGICANKKGMITEDVGHILMFGIPSIKQNYKSYLTYQDETKIPRVSGFHHVY